VNGKRTVVDLAYRIAHLRESFGLDRAIDITTDRARAYQRKRLDEGAAAATINRELAALRNLSRAGVPEQIAMWITGHKTASMYRRYRIVDERDLRDATQSLNAYLETQPTTTVVVPMKKAAGE
jgi:hypothetical protein